MEVTIDQFRAISNAAIEKAIFARIDLLNAEPADAT